MEMFCLLKVPKSQHPSCDIVVQYGKLLTNKYAFPKYLHVLTNRGWLGESIFTCNSYICGHMYRDSLYLD